MTELGARIAALSLIRCAILSPANLVMGRPGDLSDSPHGERHPLWAHRLYLDRQRLAGPTDSRPR